MPVAKHFYLIRHLCKIAQIANYLRRICRSVCPSSWNNSAPTGPVFMKVYIWAFSKISRKMQVLLRSDENNGNFT
jgi:hypothetical protein